MCVEVDCCGVSIGPGTPPLWGCAKKWPPISQRVGGQSPPQDSDPWGGSSPPLWGCAEFGTEIANEKMLGGN